MSDRVEWRLYPPPTISIAGSAEVGKSALKQERPDFLIRQGDVVYLRGGPPRSSRHGIDHDNDSRFIYLGSVSSESLLTGGPENANSRSVKCRLRRASKTTTQGDSAVAPLVPVDHIVKRKRLLPVFQQATASATASAMSPVQSPSDDREATSMVVSSDTKSYRELAESQVTSQDRVLEIGCSTGEAASIFVSRSVASWVGLDNSSDMVATTLQRLQRELLDRDQRGGSGSTTTRISGHAIDLLLDPCQAQRSASQFGSPTVVFVDVGGNRRVSGVVRVLSWVLSNCHPLPRLIVAKSSNVYAELATALESSRPHIGTLSCGLVPRAQLWFEHQLTASHRECLPKHPLKAALVLAPRTPGSSKSPQPICRYHNYHEQGCARAATGVCPYNHDYCHLCVKTGHVARHCPLLRVQEHMVPSLSQGGSGET